MLDGLPTQSQQIVLANMKQSASLTLGIFKSLYPGADLDVAGEGFMAICIDEEASKHVEDSDVTVEHIMDLLPVDMS
jgi:hypothetical protein